MAERTEHPILAAGSRRPTAKSVETRARIVAGALKALERNGIGETTTRRIADEAGIRLATLHYHFATKEAILLAVLEEVIAELTATLRGGPNGREPLPRRIEHLVRTAWAYAEATREKQVVQYELTLYALRTMGSGWLAERQYGAYVSAYRAQLWVGPDDGINAESADDLARFILAGLDGLILQWLAGLSSEQAAAGIAALIVSAQTYAWALVDRATRRTNDPTDNGSARKTGRLT